MKNFTKLKLYFKYIYVILSRETCSLALGQGELCRWCRSFGLTDVVNIVSNT